MMAWQELFARLYLQARFDLRFIVVQDRWEYTTVRSIEEMKSRYYAVARRLLEARADNPEEASSHPIIKEPFNAQHEAGRCRLTI